MTLTESLNNSQLKRWRLQWLLTFRRLDHRLFPSLLRRHPSFPALPSGDSPPFHCILSLSAFVFPVKLPPSLRLLLLPMSKVRGLGFNFTIPSSLVSKISPRIRICFSNSVLHHYLLLQVFLRKICMLVSDSDFSIQK